MAASAVNTDDALARLAAFGLPGISTEPVVFADPDEFLGAAEAARVLPWIVAALTAGQIDGVNSKWCERLREVHLRPRFTQRWRLTRRR